MSLATVYQDISDIYSALERDQITAAEAKRSLEAIEKDNPSISIDTSLDALRSQAGTYESSYDSSYDDSSC